MSKTIKTSRDGRSIGIGLMIIGLAILALSIFLAYQGFTYYKPVTPSAGDPVSAFTQASFELINLAGKLAFLGVMVWASSIILNTGVKLFRRIDAEEVRRLLREYSEK